MRPIVAYPTKSEMTMAKEPMMRDRKELNATRPKRVPIHEQRDQMSVDKREGFVRRWVNDLPGRVEKFLRAGYDVVKDDEVKVGEGGVTDSNKALGTGARKDVGRTRGGDGPQAVLMEIPQELYEEDQKAKQAAVDATDNVLKRNIREHNLYGEVKQSSTFARKKKA
jgi:hypothetical protein